VSGDTTNGFRSPLEGLKLVVEGVEIMVEDVPDPPLKA
jgi:hypothetical protein